MKPLLVYDCEIIKAIPDRKADPVPGIEYCDGWRDFENMGISVIGAYDYETGCYRVFLEDNFPEFAELLKKRTAVAYNGRAFDDQLVAAHGMPTEDTYDIFAEILEAAGTKSFAGYGLDAVCEKNLGMRKTGNGALAPILWQQGKRGQVIDYCLNDVMMERALLDLIRERGEVVSPVTGDVLHVRKPGLVSVAA